MMIICPVPVAHPSFFVVIACGFVILPDLHTKTTEILELTSLMANDHYLIYI
jgi:hypothetical protein